MIRVFVSIGLVSFRSVPFGVLRSALLPPIVSLFCSKLFGFLFLSVLPPSFLHLFGVLRSVLLPPIVSLFRSTFFGFLYLSVLSSSGLVLFCCVAFCSSASDCVFVLF